MTGLDRKVVPCQALGYDNRDNYSMFISVYRGKAKIAFPYNTAVF